MLSGPSNNDSVIFSRIAYLGKYLIVSGGQIPICTAVTPVAVMKRFFSTCIMIVRCVRRPHLLSMEGRKGHNSVLLFYL